MRHLLALLIALSPLPALADYVSGLQPGGALAVRSGPGTGFARLYEIPEGTAVEVREASGDWRRVILPDGHWGWVSARFLSAAADAPPADGNGIGGWQTYVNPRFGTTIDYPATVFQPQPPPQNEDGRLFLAPDGSAELRVSARHNVLNQSLADLRAADRANTRYDQITYEPVGDDWYVLSGYAGPEIFYRRVLLRDGVVHSFELYFPREARASWDAAVTRMSRSFGVR